MSLPSLAFQDTTTSALILAGPLTHCVTLNKVLPYLSDSPPPPPPQGLGATCNAQRLDWIILRPFPALPLTVRGLGQVT